MSEKAIEAAVEEFKIAVWGEEKARWMALIPEEVEALKRRVTKIIAAYEAAMWRPIEEAPKDGTPVLAFYPGSLSEAHAVFIVRYDKKRDGWKHMNHAAWGFAAKNFPISFRPLPAAPESEG